MKGNPLQKVGAFIVRYIWLFCMVLIIIELFSTLFSATTLLRQTSLAVRQAHSGEISSRVDGVLRLLNGLADDEVIGDTSLPIYDRAIRMRSYQESYDLYMLAVLDREFNVSSSDETEPPKEPFSLASRDYLQRMRATGKYQVTDMIIAGADGVTKNYTISVPLLENGEVAGGIFGSIYFDDIEEILTRENQGTFYLLGREGTVMAGGLPEEYEMSAGQIYDGCFYLGATAEQVETDIREGRSGDYWVMGNLGPAYVTYSPIPLTEWTLIYEARFDLVIPTIMPLLIAKILCYIALCQAISWFGRRYLERSLSDVNHLLERVTQMRKELFRTEQPDYEGLLKLTQQGLSDHLTGLSTRGVFVQRFSQYIEEEQPKGMMCFLDLDDLKSLNDTFGHEIGDCALLHFAQVLKSFEQEYNGIAARYGGDEFILVIRNLDMEKGREIAEGLRRALWKTLDAKEQKVDIHGSIGVVFYPENGMDLEELISKADLALYKAKKNGKNQVFLYDS